MITVKSLNLNLSKHLEIKYLKHGIWNKIKIHMKIVRC